MIKMSVLVVATLISSTTALASSNQDGCAINFGIDCMIHDAQGAMLSDLGMVGAMSGGMCMPSGKFSYQNLAISADLETSSTTTPEVAGPVLGLSVSDSSGNVIAASMVSAQETTNVALWIPGANLFLHCAEMSSNR
jgi:hypothetical protein